MVDGGGDAGVSADGVGAREDAHAFAAAVVGADGSSCDAEMAKLEFGVVDFGLSCVHGIHDESLLSREAEVGGKEGMQVVAPGGSKSLGALPGPCCGSAAEAGGRGAAAGTDTVKVHASGSAGAEPKQDVKEGRRRRRGRGATGDGFASACLIEDVVKAALQVDQLE